MSMSVDVKLPSSAPLQSLNYNLFPKGVITLINESNLPHDALKEAQNCMLYENGSAGPRWGINWFGSTLPGTGSIDGAGSYLVNDGTVQLWAVRGGVLYSSTNDGASWTTISGFTFTVGAKITGTQANQDATSGRNYMFFTNFADPIVRYDGVTLTAYVPIATPTGLSASPTGLSGGVYTYYYRVAAVNNIGVTVGTITATASVGTTRDAWDPTNIGTKYVTLSWSAPTGAVTRYDIYLTDNPADDAANNLFYLDSVTSTTYIDRGQLQVNPNSQVPIQNTTGGPTLGELRFVGGRLFGTRDKNNKYRVWWTGSGPFLGYFSDAYDGGYVDLQKGGSFFPVHIEDYRDGKATPLVTVWCDSADGQGCIWQGSLDTQTLQNQQYTQPNFNKLPGSRGTRAPLSVVNVLNDYVYFNYQAVYNLGSRAQFLNLLSTDESTVNIRPTLLDNITPGATSGAAAFYYRAKIFMSLPFNSTNNSVTMVYDTERKAWIPYAYTMGAERWFQYTDTTGRQHLLFWKTGDARLSETSEYISGDYGQGFESVLTTGLLPVDPKKRFAFFLAEQADLEFSNPQGSIQVELYGIERTKGYGLQKTATVIGSAVNTNIGWSSASWSSALWSDTSVVPTPYLETSAKRYYTFSKELNAHQWRITSSDVSSSWLVRNLQLDGTYTEDGLPRQWRLTAK